MARETISAEQRENEGAKLREIMSRAQKKEPDLTQESLAGEIGVTQGLVGQWMSGRTSIPDKRLLWLSQRLDFDPVEFRPSIVLLSAQSKISSNSKLAAVIQQIPKDQEDNIAEILARILEARK